MTIEMKDKKWKWREFLTSDEEVFIAAADAAAKKVAAAQSEWNRQFGTERPKIVNRAIQRAKAAARLV